MHDQIISCIGDLIGWRYDYVKITVLPNTKWRQKVADVCSFNDGCLFLDVQSAC